MTDTLREECQALCEKLDKAFVCNRSTLGESVEMLMAFARSQQAKVLREAEEMAIDYAELEAGANDDFEKGMRRACLGLSSKLKAQATAREQGKAPHS